MSETTTTAIETINSLIDDDCSSQDGINITPGGFTSGRYRMERRTSQNHAAKMEFKNNSQRERVSLSKRIQSSFYLILADLQDHFF